MNQTQYSISRASEIEASTDLPRSKEEANSIGATFFFTGKPCRNGHIAPRYAKSSPICIECAKASYAKRKTKILADLKAAYKANPEKYREKERKYAEADPKYYWAKSVVSKARGRAKVFNLPFNINVAYIKSITPDICPVFGIRFNFYGNGKTRKESATLDRKVPELGYVPGNVAVISHRANSIKHNASTAEIRAVADWMESEGL